MQGIRPEKNSQKKRTLHVRLFLGILTSFMGSFTLHISGVLKTKGKTPEEED